MEKPISSSLAVLMLLNCLSSLFGDEKLLLTAGKLFRVELTALH